MCKKCGSTEVSVRYHTQSSGSRGCGYLDFSEDKDPHLHHYCKMCGYDWTGPTKDEK